MAASPADNSDETDAGLRKPDRPLRRGWTTGACATAATKAALNALLTGEFEDPVTITLPKGETPAFPLAHEKLTNNSATAAIIKDGGDDPDVTHGATIEVIVSRASPGSGVQFHAGDGVGTVTKPGLPIGVGEAAINPVPRRMMIAEVEALCKAHGMATDIDITISVPGGTDIATKTWNPRLGIIGGISILGTTGIVHPFSCAAWIHSIHRGIDVARAAGLDHVIGSTGSTSETAAQALYDAPEIALLDMGDFAGGLLKYIRNHPVPKLTLAGGFAKMTKLAQGAMDLHSSRSQVDMAFLLQLLDGQRLNQDMKTEILTANTAQQVLELTRDLAPHLPLEVARHAARHAMAMLKGSGIAVQCLIVDRKGVILAQTSFDA